LIKIEEIEEIVSNLEQKVFFLTIEEKIDVESLVRKNPKSVLPETFSSVDAFCGVVALAVYEILLFLGIIV